MYNSHFLASRGAGSVGSASFRWNLGLMSFKLSFLSFSLFLWLSFVGPIAKWINIVPSEKKDMPDSGKKVGSLGCVFCVGKASESLSVVFNLLE
jgi:hypothetical protein